MKDRFANRRMTWKGRLLVYELEGRVAGSAPKADTPPRVKAQRHPAPPSRQTETDPSSPVVAAAVSLVRERSMQLCIEPTGSRGAPRGSIDADHRKCSIRGRLMVPTGEPQHAISRLFG